MRQATAAQISAAESGTPGYGSSAERLSHRMMWAQAMIARTLHAARSQGWAPGNPDEVTAWVSPELITTTMGQALLATSEPDLPPMDLLVRRLGLGAVEADVLWLLACIELEPVLGRLAATLGVGTHLGPSVQLVQRMVTPPGQLGAISCPLEMIERLYRWQLIELDPDPRLGLGERAVRVCDRVIDLAIGTSSLDRELAEVASLHREANHSSRDLELPTEAGGAWYLALTEHTPDLFLFSSRDERCALDRCRTALTAARRGYLEIHCQHLAPDGEVLRRQCRALARECALWQVVPVLRQLDQAGDRITSIDRELLAGVGDAALATATAAFAPSLGRRITACAVALPSLEQRTQHWRAALPTLAPEVLECTAQAYPVSAQVIAEVSAAVRAAVSIRGQEIHREDIQQAMRGYLQPEFSELAHRVETTQTWDDLILEADQLSVVIELIARVKHHKTVLRKWGFARKVGRGLGTTALLSGPPGTGKTMIAGLIARELGVDLYQADLSKIVSRYLGEAEKQLARLFDAAEASGCMLLFDEADALFSRRTEVRSSNDRYANLEVNFLLQRIESFSGVCLLTSNHERAIDDAFRRRLSVHLRLPAPDLRQRAQLWKALLPEEAEVASDLDFVALARDFDLAGGNIRNAVLRAAFLAAHEGREISMQHLHRAATIECQTSGKVLRGDGAQ
jgi:SpoVK/Ycf46/Vps4 family AAA+-type ATPase